MPLNPHSFWYADHYYSPNRYRLAQAEYKLIKENAKAVLNPSIWVWCTGKESAIDDLELKYCNNIIKHIEAGKYCAGQQHKLYSVQDQKKKLKENEDKVLTKKDESATMNTSPSFGAGQGAFRAMTQEEMVAMYGTSRVRLHSFYAPSDDN